MNEILCWCLTISHSLCSQAEETIALTVAIQICINCQNVAPFQLMWCRPVVNKCLQKITPDEPKTRSTIGNILSSLHPLHLGCTLPLCIQSKGFKGHITSKHGKRHV